jgi:hypothetical protein
MLPQQLTSREVQRWATSRPLSGIVDARRARRALGLGFRGGWISTGLVAAFGIASMALLASAAL